jgi:hypothetical protein
LSNCKRLVGKFKHTEDLQKTLHGKQLSLNQQYKLKLVQDISIRWNSTYDLVYSILVNKDPLLSMKIDNVSLPVLTDGEFSLAEDFCIMLNNLKELTVFLSASSYVTCTMIFPAIYTLVTTELPNMTISDDDFCCLKNELINILKKRFKHVLDSSVNSLYVAACYLDIGFRDLLFIENAEARTAYNAQAKNFILRVSTQYPATEVQPEPNLSTLTPTVSMETNNQAPQTSSATDSPLICTNRNSKETPQPGQNNTPHNERNPRTSTIPTQQQTPIIRPPPTQSRLQMDRLNTGFLSRIPTTQVVVNTSTMMSTLEKQISDYEHMAPRKLVVKEGEDKAISRALNFWQACSNEGQLPELARVARIILSATASSVPSESEFSIAGLTQTDLRNRLEPSCLNKLNFLKHNIKREI